MSEHDHDTCPHLVRASLLEAEVDQLRKELADLQESYHLLNETLAKFIRKTTK